MISGDPTFDAGQIGRAVTFDGDTEVSFGNAGAFDRTQTVQPGGLDAAARQPTDLGLPEARRSASIAAGTNGGSTTCSCSTSSGGRRRLTITLTSDAPATLSRSALASA